MRYEVACSTIGGTTFIRKYKNGREVYYNADNRIIKIIYPNGKVEEKDYYDNGVLKLRVYPNGKCERYNIDKKLVYRKHDNCEEAWLYNQDGKCIEYTKHVYYK